jgi:NAD(P)-dependent dehydrogenase (short-subunit alcohol dehydrogenase family)
MSGFIVKDAVAFVTGADRSNGIGRAIVNALLDAGAAKVYATALKASLLDALVDAHPKRVVAVGLDLTNLKQLESLSLLFPDVTLVVNNAGYAAFTNSIDDVDKSLEEIMVNYIAPLAITKSFAPIFANLDAALDGEESKYERVKPSAVVNINSITSYVNFPAFATYSASRAASHSLTQAQRRDLKNTLVVGVYPGPEEVEAITIDENRPVPILVARSVIVALEHGIEDVFPDIASKAIHHEWKADAKLLERRMAA